MAVVKNVSLVVVVAGGTLLVLVAAAATAGALMSWWTVLVLLVLTAAALAAHRRLRKRIPRKAILELDLERGLIEQVPQSPLGRALAGEAYVLRDVVDALHRAAVDRRVVGLVARVGPADMAVARAQEVSDAIAVFRTAGKPAVAYAETLGEGGTARALPEMLVAASFDEFFLQPGGDLPVQGLEMRGPFLRGVMDKLGIGVRFDHRHEYKAAMYRLTEDHMPEPAREANQAVVDARFAQLVAGIAAGRGMSEEAVREAVDRAPLLAVEAEETGLVDGLLYRDQLMERVDESWGEGARRIGLSAYLKGAGRLHRRGPTVALVYGTGAIARGKSRFEPLGRAPTMSSDEVAKAFQAAIDNKRVRAIVFRVDSPGGSASASEVIRREVDRARDKGKPVVASMGDVAGSGGYWVAATSDAIVAQPGTITGSIGVLTGKFVTREALARAGIRFDEVHVGANAGFGTPDRDYTEREWERVQAQLDGIYAEFVRLVAEGRAMDPADVERVARGRIWSGADARGHGLVDELGGLHRACAIAAEKAGIEDRYRVQVFPRPKSTVGTILQRRKPGDGLGAALQSLAPVVDLASDLQAAAGYGVVSMPGFRNRH